MSGRYYNRAMPPRRNHSAATAALAALLALPLLPACTSLPDNAVQETLEEATGTSVTRLARPIELTTVQPRGPNADPFAYVAPFETNRMGRRQAYLWIAVPDERGEGGNPELSIGGAALPLGEPVDLRSAGLGAAPYARPAPWSAEFLFVLDDSGLRSLAQDGEWRIAMQRPGASSLTFAGSPAPPDLLQRFLGATGSAAH